MGKLEGKTDRQAALDAGYAPSTERGYTESERGRTGISTLFVWSDADDTEVESCITAIWSLILGSYGGIANRTQR